MFLGLYTLGLIYWSNKPLLRRVCIATALLALVFAAYRPLFAIFFALVAAFAPFTVGGSIPLSATFILGVVFIHVLEAFVLRGGQYFVFAAIIGIESALIGAGTTFAARQQNAIRRANMVAERERIARDLHDILGHMLSSIVLKSELAGKLLDHNVERARVEITDIEMPELSGLDVAESIKDESPTRVIIVTTFARPGYLRRAMEAGATCRTNSKSDRRSCGGGAVGNGGVLRNRFVHWFVSIGLGRDRHRQRDLLSDDVLIGNVFSVAENATALGVDMADALFGSTRIFGRRWKECYQCRYLHCGACRANGLIRRTRGSTIVPCGLSSEERLAIAPMERRFRGSDV